GNNETNTAQTIRVLNNSLILIPELEKQYNAALSGEQRDHNPKPLRLKHKTQPRIETPKRWESVLNA
ncbi:hypothetical protein, partial [Vibrio vulnificus]|uniref:hypothetical protein n=1 Tax=Vibrio vulnificus TaxID=672 RepID=UPI003EDA615E